MFIVFNGKGWLVPMTAIGAGVLCAVADLRDQRERSDRHAGRVPRGSYRTG